MQTGRVTGKHTVSVNLVCTGEILYGGLSNFPAGGWRPPLPSPNCVTEAFRLGEGGAHELAHGPVLAAYLIGHRGAVECV